MHTGIMLARKGEFRLNLRSHSWCIDYLFVFIAYVYYATFFWSVLFSDRQGVLPFKLESFYKPCPVTTASMIMRVHVREPATLLAN